MKSYEKVGLAENYTIDLSRGTKSQISVNEFTATISKCIVGYQ